MHEGKVYLIGAGPGDPKLLTLRAVEALAESDVILMDYLVSREVLAHARQGVELIDCGKRAGHHCMPQEEIQRILIERARRGQIIARLKGGDPFIFGRGGEEAEALVEAGIEWEVIPGISSGIAAAAYAGIPLLHRSHASSVAFVTGHAGHEHAVGEQEADTLVIFMGGSTILQIARELMESGRAPSTPLALILSGTRSNQAVYTGTLVELARMERIELASPVLAVVGDVTALADKLHWFGPPPKPLHLLAMPVTAVS